MTRLLALVMSVLLAHGCATSGYGDHGDAPIYNTRGLTDDVAYCASKLKQKGYPKSAAFTACDKEVKQQKMLKASLLGTLIGLLLLIPLSLVVSKSGDR